MNRRNRMRSASTFTEVFEKGTSYSSKNFVILAVDSPENRYGFAVSKKIGNAVRRNFARRRLRELFRHNLKHLPNNKDLVLLAKPGVIRERFSLLQAELIDLLNRIK